MDIYSLVNSKVIEEYLRQIGYEFNSLEAAWLIYSCRRLSFEEKKDLWNELVASMPDCEVPIKYNCAGWKSLHSFLKEYIGIIDREITQFYKEDALEEYIYMYSYLYKGDDRWTEEYESIFSSLSKCLEAYEKDMKELDEMYSCEKTGMVKYRIKRCSLVDPQEVFKIEFFGDGRLVQVLDNTKRTNEEEMLINLSFDGMWFDFPTPFKKGDIVWVPCDDNNIGWNCDGGFVLKRISTWNQSKCVMDGSDNSDMSCSGYFVNENGTIYSEVMSGYMDLEYYYGPYRQNERILPALSKYMKGEIEVDLLLYAYRKVVLDVMSDDIMFKNWYSKESLENIGLE
ncbi:MAG: hypothetical protein IJD02_03440 [Lachnospiraceae bacterium]|nr:hypothetical protein [Lachnospiraceae bacterium]